ncbi:MAG: pyridoxamine 5'-phosphate oxidase family protein [Defluviitaleaceae bacterium]|nr:pyridoxamine 5'-phosphate oxidase family protein [Defluviitaleaceae bacterium]
MRRSQYQIEDTETLIELLNECKIMRVAMIDGETPYIVPVNYAYELSEGILTMYFHCAIEGRKIDILKKNKNVCFELDGRFELVMGKDACSTSCKYASIIGSGKAESIDDVKGKTSALSLIMEQQTGKPVNDFPEAALAKTAVFLIRSKDFTGKTR